MTELDETLLEYTNLITLNLCGNYICNFNAKFVGSSLRFLELQANSITSINDFVEDLPMELLYLGLGRNLLCTGKIKVSISRVLFPSYNKSCIIKRIILT